MQAAVIEHIAREADTLTLSEYTELLERLVQRLRIRYQPDMRAYDWKELYGLGKGIWGKEDAQDYVNRLREDRA